MSLISRIGYRPRKREPISVIKSISCKEISIIVPVKDNQKGIDTFLNALEEVTRKEHHVKEVIIVDNLSKMPVEVQGKYSFNVIVTSCKIIGPAAARNQGASIAHGTWLLFLDSDCIPSSTTISGYLTEQNQHLAYAGNVKVSSQGWLSNYYETQEILIPPEAIDSGAVRPDYLVTANCLIYKEAFDKIGGFDETFKQAGGEDIDLAFRLLTIGSIEYQWNSIVYHNFDDGFIGFIKRFNRYGKGNKQLAKKHTLNLSPRCFIPEKVSLINLALSFIQFLSMSKGYHSYELIKNEVKDIRF